MADNPLVKKMKLTAGARAAVLGGPPGYLRSLELTAEMDLSEKRSGRHDWMQLFVKARPGLGARIGAHCEASRAVR